MSKRGATKTSKPVLTRPTNLLAFRHASTSKPAAAVVYTEPKPEYPPKLFDSVPFVVPLPDDVDDVTPEPNRAWPPPPFAGGLPSDPLHDLVPHLWLSLAVGPFAPSAARAFIPSVPLVEDERGAQNDALAAIAAGNDGFDDDTEPLPAAAVPIVATVPSAPTPPKALACTACSVRLNLDVIEWAAAASLGPLPGDAALAAVTAKASAAAASPPSAATAGAAGGVLGKVAALALGIAGVVADPQSAPAGAARAHAAEAAAAGGGVDAALLARLPRGVRRLFVRSGGAFGGACAASTAPQPAAPLGLTAAAVAAAAAVGGYSLRLRLVAVHFHEEDDARPPYYGTTSLPAVPAAWEDAVAAWRVEGGTGGVIRGDAAGAAVTCCSGACSARRERAWSCVSSSLFDWIPSGGRQPLIDAAAALLVGEVGEAQAPDYDADSVSAWAAGRREEEAEDADDLACDADDASDAGSANVEASDDDDGDVAEAAEGGEGGGDATAKQDDEANKDAANEFAAPYIVGPRGCVSLADTVGRWGVRPFDVSVLAASVLRHSEIASATYPLKLMGKLAAETSSDEDDGDAPMATPARRVRGDDDDDVFALVDDGDAAAAARRAVSIAAFSAWRCDAAAAVRAAAPGMLTIFGSAVAGQAGGGAPASGPAAAAEGSGSAAAAAAADAAGAAATAITIRPPQPRRCLERVRDCAATRAALRRLGMDADALAEAIGSATAAAADSSDSDAAMSSDDEAITAAGRATEARAREVMRVVVAGADDADASDSGSGSSRSSSSSSGRSSCSSVTAPVVVPQAAPVKRPRAPRASAATRDPAKRSAHAPPAVSSEPVAAPAVAISPPAAALPAVTTAATPAATPASPAAARGAPASAAASATASSDPPQAVSTDVAAASAAAAPQAASPPARAGAAGSGGRGAAGGAKAGGRGRGKPPPAPPGRTLFTFGVQLVKADAAPVTPDRPTASSDAANLIPVPIEL